MIEKVKEPQVEETYDCQRCRQTYCSECAEPIEVEFEITDKPEGLNQAERDWEGEHVCPWCYNQLVDKFNKRVIK